MFDKVKLIFRNSIIYSLGNLSIALTGYLLIPVYTRHLALAEYGLLGILEVTFQIISNIFGFALYEAYNRWYFEKTSTGKQKSIFFTIIMFLLVIILILITVLFSLSEHISLLLFDNPELSYVFRLMVISASLQILSRLPLTLMKLQQLAGFYAMSNIARLVSVLLFTIYFVVGLHRNLAGIYEAQIIGHIFFFLIILKYIAKNIELRFESKILMDIWKYSYPLTLSAVIVMFLTVTDRYCLKFLANFEEIGIYSLGFKIASGIKLLIMQSLYLAISPMIYQMMDSPENKRFYSKLMTYLGLTVMIFVLGASIFSREIILIVARQESYYAAYIFIPILSLGVFFELLRDLSLTGINISKRTKIIPVIGFLVSLINLTINLILIPLIGAMGSAIATLSSNILFFSLIYIRAQKIYFIPYELKKIFILVFVAAGLYYLSEMLSNFNTIERIISKSVLLCAFPFVLHVFKFYEEIELQSFRQILTKIRINLSKST